jgi:hypothetical protein
VGEAKAGLEITLPCEPDVHVVCDNNSDGLSDIIYPDNSLLQQVTAAEMHVGCLYLSKHGARCRVTRQPDVLAEDVKILFWEPIYHKAWMEATIPFDYTMRKLDIEYHHDQSRGPEVSPRSKGHGLVSGMKMMECWGLYFKQFIRVPGGREKIVAAMDAEFPDKAAGNKKWVDAYKSYYNLGRLPGCIKQLKKLNWITNDPLATILE